MFNRNLAAQDIFLRPVSFFLVRFAVLQMDTLDDFDRLLDGFCVVYRCD